MKKNLKDKKPIKKRKPKTPKTCIMCFTDLQKGEAKGICKACINQGEINTERTDQNQIAVDNGGKNVK